MADARWDKLKQLKGKLPPSKETVGSPPTLPVQLARDVDFRKEAERAGIRALPQRGVDRRQISHVAPGHAEKKQLERASRLLEHQKAQQQRDLQELARLNAELRVYRRGQRVSAPQPTAPTLVQKIADQRLEAIIDGTPVVPRAGNEKFDLASRKSAYLLDGWRTQPRTSKGRKRRIVVGLDFGTAFTKVCAADATTAVPIPFLPRRRTVERYLLPGRLWVTNKGVCHLGDLDAGSTQFENLKLPLLLKVWQPDDEDRVIAFLALVMRYARLWTLENADIAAGERPIDWEVNVGFPTESWNEPWRVSRFEAIVKGAWSLSLAVEQVTAQTAAVTRINLDAMGHAPETALVRVVPEFAGQVASYVKSSRRRDDLHLIADIGAGTVDVSCFNLSEGADSSDLHSVLEARVARLGSHYLLANRMHGTSLAMSWTDIEGVPTVEESASASGLSVEEIRDRDEAVTRRMAQEVSRVLSPTKQHRYPASPRWHDGIPTFLCGGGAELAAYKDFAPRTSYKVRVLPMPKPERLAADDVTTETFGRLAVAYGLSYGYDDLGTLKPPRDVPDAPRPATKDNVLDDRFISKDQV